MNQETLDKIKEEHSITEIHSVSSLNEYIFDRYQTDDYLSSVYLYGEISNLSITAKNYAYFDLKDKNTKIACVMFNFSDEQREFVQDGKEVLILGKVDFYKVYGKTQIRLSKIFQVGEGAISLKLRKLTEKLRKEGLFDEQRKKRLPSFPQKIGVISSKSGDGIKDIINSIQGKFPIVDINVYHTSVQGTSCANEVCRGILFFNSIRPVDIIIIGRGGGSIEDLMAFNDESLARTICDSSVPIITGIGHKEDYTIADYVADVHEITPTAAGKRAVPDIYDLEHRIESLTNQLNEAYGKLLKINEQQKEIERKAKMIEGKKIEIQTQAKVIEQKKAVIETQAKTIEKTKAEIQTQARVIEEKKIMVETQEKVIRLERRLKRRYKAIMAILIILLLFILGLVFF